MTTVLARQAQITHTTAEWNSIETILQSGEIVYEVTSDGKYFEKVGDGIHKFSDLSYAPEDIYTKLSENANVHSYQNVIKKMLNGESVSIVCYGDSITFGYIPSGGGAQTANPYPSVLQTILRDFYKNTNIVVYNEGYSGRQSDELASDDYIAYVTRHAPDLVIVMVGLNDKIGNYGDITNLDTFISNLKMIKDKLSGIYGYDLLWIPPTPNWSGDNATYITNYFQKQTTDLYVQAVKDFVSKNGIPFIDLNEGIKEYYYNNIVKVPDASPDLLHYTDDFYHKIADYIFAYGLCNVDIIVNNEKKYPSLHSIFIPATTYNYFIDNHGVNPEKYNLLLTTAGDYYFVYVFINKKNMDFYLSTVNNYDSGNSNEVSVDGVITKVSCSNGLGYQNTNWNVRKYISTLGYGLHKIIFTAKTGGLNPYFLIEDMEFRNTQDIYNFNKEIEHSPINVISQNYEKLLFSGKFDLTTDYTSSSGTSYRKFITLPPYILKHYRIYTELGKFGGIGFGEFEVKNTNIYKAPIVWLQNSGSLSYFKLMSKILCVNNTTISDTVGTVFTSTVEGHDDTRTHIIDLFINTDTSISLYLDGVLFYTFSNTWNLGELVLWVCNYNTPDTVNLYSAITKVEELNNNMSATTFVNGDTYFDAFTESQKIYINGTWKTITVS